MNRKFWKKLTALVLAVSMMNFAPVGWDVQAEESGTVIDVTDYGADPSGKHDSTEAVMAALEEAKTMEGKKTLSFPYGEYRFDEDHSTTRVYHTSNTSSRSYPEKKIGILLEDVENLTIEGNGSTLLVYGDIMALAVVESSDIKMENFVLDYKDADTIDVSVVRTDVDENGKPYADLYVPAAYNYEISADGKHIEWQGDISVETGKPYWTWKDADFCAYLVVYKGYDRTVIRATNKTASNPFTGVESIVPSGESTVRFTYQSELPTDIVEGNIYQLSNSAWRQTAGAFFWESEDLTVENIDVHYLSGFGWLTQMCKNVEFKSVDFLPREGSGKYTTSNADQLHVSGCGGYFKVTDCNFSMAHDDPINVHGTYMRVEEVIDARTVRMQYIHGQQGGFRQFHEGDEVLFYSRTYLEEPDGQVEAAPFIVESSIGPGEEYKGSKLDLVTEIVTFAEDLPKETVADLKKTVTKNSQVQPLYVAENVTYTPAVTIKGNRMKSIPTRGILCTTRQEVIIEDNIFDNMAMASIYLSNDADDWYESGPIRNLTVRNNTFYIRPTGQSAVGTVSGVFIEPITIPSWAMNGGETAAKNSETPVHKNITIEGNTFHISNDNVVTANRVDGLTIKNNTIIHDDTPAISLDTKAVLGVGKSQEIHVDVAETVLQKDVFQFNDCQNVTVDGNTFDEGMNLNIKLDTKMSANDLTLGENEQAVLTVNKTGGNYVTSADKVQLLSTNPEVAYVDEAGKLVGVKEGKTTVLAYIEKNGALLVSDEVEVTVGDSQGAELTIDADKTFFETKGETVSLKATQDNVSYTVLDPFTMKKTDKATVTENVYTAKKDGIVLIKAATESDTAELLMINSFDVSYGDKGGLADGISIDNPTTGGTTSSDEHSVQIAPQNNGNGIWTGSALVNNIVNLRIPEEMRKDLRIQVTAEGLVSRGSGWNSSGIMIYTDLNNYLFAGKRNHIDGVSTMYEKNASAEEFAGNSSANALTALTFEFEVKGTTAYLRYLDADGSWKEIDNFEVDYLQTSNMKLGLASWLNGGAEFTPTYSDIRMAKASETTTQSLGDMEPISLYQSFENDRPEMNAPLELEAGYVNESATVNATAIDAAGIVYQWNLQTLQGVKTVYTSESTYTPTEAGTLSVRAIAVDEYGKPSEPVESNSVEVKVNLSQKDALQSLFINGNRIENFEPDTYEYEIYVPTNVEKLRISYGEENAGQATLISGKGKYSIPTGENSIVVDLHDSYTLTHGSETYKINVHQVESNANELTALQVGGQTVDLADEIKVGTDSYFVHVDEDTFPVKITAQEGVSEIKVTRSFYEHAVADNNAAANVFEADVEMKAGINAYYIYITAADGVSTREVKLYLFRDVYTDCSLEGIVLNGKNLEEFEGQQEEYIIRIGEEDAKKFAVEAKAKEGQLTSITVKNARTEGTRAEVTLEGGLNEIIITNVAKDLWSKHFYTLNVIVESDDNAELLNLTASEIMKPVFENGVTSYYLENNSGKLNVSAQAQLAEANIEMYLKGSKQRASADGQLSYEFELYEGRNQIVVKVTAADGKTTNIYELQVDAKGLVYASDVIAKGTLEGITSTKVKVGYGSITLDTNVDGNAKISLADENGNKVEFDKGLGTHASSELIYKLDAGHEFEYFEAYTGVDYAKYSYDASTVTFEVWVDGKKAYDSREVLGGATRVTTPMQFVQVDISGAEEVKLITKEFDNNAYDHSEWADACFTRSLGEMPVKNEIVRISGNTRYETGYKVADALKEELGVAKFEAVIVATGKNFADALAGSYLAVQKNAPILLTNGKKDNVEALHNYIKENVAEGAALYILGGDAAVPTSVEEIEGYEVKRLFGNSRYETNIKILEEAGIEGNELIVATGKTFADSLSASAVKLPILLVKPKAALNDSQKAIVEKAKGGNIYIIGGDGAVSLDMENELKAYADVERVFGNTRYDTSVEVAKTFFGSVDKAVVASGKNFPDGLCGGPLSAAMNAPLILTADGKTGAAEAYVAEKAVEAGSVLGGDGALKNDTIVKVFGLKSAEEIIEK